VSGGHERGGRQLRGHLASSLAFGLAASVAAPMVACGDGSEPGDRPERQCTQIGCRSGVRILLETLPDAAVDVRLCVGERCRTVRAEEGRMVFAPLRESGRRHRVSVRVVARNRADEPLPAAERRVRPRRVRPNGPGCPPVCFIVRLSFRANDGLVPAR
jgi:hypothetical protein